MRIISCLVSLIISLAANSQTDSIFRAFEKEGFPCYHTDSAHIMPTGKAKFADLLKHIAEAKEYIHVEYFKFWNDSIGRVVLDALAEKAAQGVEVRVLYDGIGNYGKETGCDKGFVQRQRARGIRMYGFDEPRFPWLNAIVHRDHRKIVIIDGKICYTGGFNIADYYINGRKKLGGWRDMHIRMHGEEISGGYERLFEDLWNKTTKENLHKPVKVYAEETQADGAPTYVVSREPWTKNKAMRRAFKMAIDGAQERIVIVNPYPMHCRMVRKALYRALERGVKVQYMVSYICDHGFTTDMIGVEMHRLQKRGAEIFLYHGAFHHDKVMLIDNVLASVGTANMDCRSMKFDWEVTSFMKSEKLTKELQQVFDDDLARSTQLTDENYTLLYTGWQRAFGTFMRLFNGVL